MLFLKEIIGSLGPAVFYAGKFLVILIAGLFILQMYNKALESNTESQVQYRFINKVISPYV
jgi:hypothetical protein